MEKTITPLRTIKEVKANTFIYEQHNALPADLCQDMIRRFEELGSHLFTFGQLVDDLRDACLPGHPCDLSQGRAEHETRIGRRAGVYDGHCAFRQARTPGRPGSC